MDGSKGRSQDLFGKACVFKLFMGKHEQAIEIVDPEVLQNFFDNNLPDIHYTAVRRSSFTLRELSLAATPEYFVNYFTKYTRAYLYEPLSTAWRGSSVLLRDATSEGIVCKTRFC